MLLEADTAADGGINLTASRAASSLALGVLRSEMYFQLPPNPSGPNNHSAAINPMTPKVATRAR